MKSLTPKKKARSKNPKTTRGLKTGQNAQHRRIISKKSNLQPKAEGNYYHIEVRSPEAFLVFHVLNVGSSGHIQKVSAKLQNGSWQTQTWLIAKQDAHVEKGRLKADTFEAQEILSELKSLPEQIEGDLFRVNSA